MREPLKFIIRTIGLPVILIALYFGRVRLSRLYRSRSQISFAHPDDFNAVLFEYNEAIARVERSMDAWINVLSWRAFK